MGSIAAASTARALPAPGANEKGARPLAETRPSLTLCQSLGAKAGEPAFVLRFRSGGESLVAALTRDAPVAQRTAAVAGLEVVQDRQRPGAVGQRAVEAVERGAGRRLATGSDRQSVVQVLSLIHI